jgi:hypothetical protein
MNRKNASKIETTPNRKQGGSGLEVLHASINMRDSMISVGSKINYNLSESDNDSDHEEARHHIKAISKQQPVV